MGRVAARRHDSAVVSYLALRLGTIGVALKQQRHNLDWRLPPCRQVDGQVAVLQGAREVVCGF